ncbi:DgyrCDS5499 [Dimorphilus gyrociliatus]|uniref:DgyrCDS5499 n=1 Tax=Dimorphilus gyrociliatus TaxID=2664684 RepID=A0A7I8VK74_9ANNE|nr:DgyrCDS5499 [Dimorphilus gyrociliatus]
MNKMIALAIIGMALVASSFAALEYKSGDICALNSQCPTGFICNRKRDHYNCELGKCACPDHYYQDSDTCKKKSTEGQSCTVSSTCDTDLMCISSKCTKLVEKKLGATCDLSKDICLYSSCISSKCDCITGYFKDGEKCRLKKHKESCKSDNTENCEANLQCKSSVCECPDDYVWRKVKNEDGEDKDMCEHKDVERVMTSAKEGQSCGTKSYGGSRSNQIFLSYCVEDLKCNRCYGVDGDYNVCRGTAASILGRFFTCIISSHIVQSEYDKKLGDVCTKDWHCPASAFCDKSYSGGNLACEIGRCKCKKDFYPQNSECRATKPFGSTCTYSNECSANIQYGRCLNRRCSCINNKFYVERNGVCEIRNPKNYGQECLISSDLCLGNNVWCKLGKCACRTGYSRIENVCRLKKYQESCSTNDIRCESNLQCKASVCICRNGYQWSKYKNAHGKDFQGCILSTTEFVLNEVQNNEACDADCYNDNHCGTNYCCDKTSRNNELKCDYGSCKCKPGYFRINDTYCKESIGHGKDCDNNNQCNLEKYLTCINSKCQCPDKYKLEGDRCVLEMPVKLGQSCTDSKAQCEGNTECNNGKCECWSWLIEKEGKCVKGELDDNCDRDSQCEGGLRCKISKCGCDDQETPFRKFEAHYNQHTYICLDKDESAESDDRTAKGENYNCGTFKAEPSPNHYVYFATKCPGDLKCTDCRDAISSSYVCRGGAKSLMSSVVLIITVIFMILI